MKTSIQEKREQLRILSAQAKMLVDVGAVDTINQGIIIGYTDATHQEFKTLKQWNDAGFKVKKGEKAFLVWGKPKKSDKKTDEPHDETEFFPIAFIFSNAQVETQK